MSSILNDPSEFTVDSLWADILGVLKRRKCFMLIVTLVASLIIYGVLLYLKDKYEVNASLIVKLGQENLEAPVSVDNGGIFRQGVMKEEINTYIALLSSAPLLEKTLDEFGIERFQQEPPPPEGVVQWVKHQVKSVVRWGKSQLNETLILVGLRKRLTDRELLLIALSKWLTVVHEKDSNVIQLNMRLIDPGLGKAYMELLIENYMEMHADHVLGGGGQELEALNLQTEQDSKKLEDLRNEFITLKKQYLVTSTAELRSELVGLMRELKQEVYENERALAGLEAKQAYIRSRETDVEEMVLSDVIKELGFSDKAAMERIGELTVERAHLATYYKEGTPKLKKIDYELAQLKELLTGLGSEVESRKTYVRNPVVEQFEMEGEQSAQVIEALRSSVSTAQIQLEEVLEDLLSWDVAEVELRRYELEISVAESRFLTNANSREEARSKELFRRSKAANVNILVPPNYNPKPVYPRRLLYMALGVVGALGISFGLALFLEWISDRMYDLRSVKNLPGVISLGEYRLKNS